MIPLFSILSLLLLRLYTEFCWRRVNLMLDMLPGEIHTPGWIKISVSVFLLKVEIYTHQAGFKIILTPNWCLLSLPDAALIDEAINPPNRIKTLNVQFTPHEIKSAHLYCKRKLFSLIKKLNLWEWIKHYASLHSLQLVSVTATIKFHIEIRPHSDNPISDQIWNPHELLWSIYLTKKCCKLFNIPYQKSPWRIE